MNPGPLVRVFVVRHAQTEWNKFGIVQGQIDTELDDEGRRQAEIVGEALSKYSFHHIFTSDLKRAYQTAEAIGKHHPSVQICKDPLLRERFMGELQGKKNTKDKAKYRDTMESGEDFSARIMKSWDERVAKPAANLTQEEGDEPIMVLMVSHGAYIATLVHTLARRGRIARAPDTRNPPCFNTSITVIDIDADGKERIVMWANINHMLQPTTRVAPTAANNVDADVAEAAEQP